MNTIRQHVLVLVVALAFLSPAVRAQQPQRPSRLTQEERIKLLEERADAAEKAASNAAMERDYITRTQRLYESYYQKAFGTQMWTTGIIGLILTGVFVLVARFSLRMIDEQTKTVTAGATVQMRNEYTRVVAKEVQKLWDANTSDLKKLKEALTAQFAELEHSLKARADFQMQFVQALAEGLEGRQGDSLITFRRVLGTYKSGKPRKLIETNAGATAIRSIFESLRKTQEDNYVEKAREELADPFYNGLEEELALAALQISWLTPLLKERKPAVPEPPAPQPAAEVRPAPPIRQVLPPDSDLALGEESDSCRLLNN